MKKIWLKPILENLRARWHRVDRSEARLKIISLSIALLLHILLVLYLRQAKIIVKILPFARETDVIIAPYPEAGLPPVLPEVIKEPPVAETQPAGPPGEAGGVSGARAGAARSTGRAEAGQPAGEAPGRGQPTIPFDLEAYLAAGRRDSQTASGVRINLSRIRPVSGKYHFSLKLPVRPEPEPGEAAEAPPALKSDVYQYASPRAYEKPGRGLRFSEGGQPRPGRPGAVTPQPAAGYRYNIKPWAEKVVSLVQSRWILPQLASLPKNKNVALILLVDREGQLLSLEVATSTTSEILDQAAITAVRLCAPFPPLPEDFPGKSLEFYLVFTYHD
ncbi:MAG: TonB family protein [Candidatus Saccharicenans sp.]|uniref:TonB family protein n=1 Tax=Candidatus Saccharicenans sp. TaxID=2819258 RepID=UPI00404A8FAD